MAKNNNDNSTNNGTNNSNSTNNNSNGTNNNNNNSANNNNDNGTNIKERILNPFNKGVAVGVLGAAATIGIKSAAKAALNAYVESKTGACGAAPESFDMNVNIDGDLPPL